MSYVVFHFEDRNIVKTYATRRGALIGLRATNRRLGYPRRWTLCEYEVDHGAVREWCEADATSILPAGQNAYAPYAVIELSLYNQHYRRTRRVNNLISGEEVEIDVNTPHCCDPSTETYWSM